MHIAETRSPLSLVGKYRLFYIDCSKDCEGMDWRGFKAFVTQFEKAFNNALIEATGEDLCHDYQSWPHGWTSNFDVKKKHETTFREVFEKVSKEFIYVQPEEKKVCKSCNERYCGNCSFSDGNKMAY